MSKAPKAVLFDLDDTLFDHRHSARSALAEWRAQNAGLQNYSLESLELEDRNSSRYTINGAVSNAVTNS